MQEEFKDPSVYEEFSTSNLNIRHADDDNYMLRILRQTKLGDYHCSVYSLGNYCFFVFFLLFSTKIINFYFLIDFGDKEFLDSNQHYFNYFCTFLRNCPQKRQNNNCFWNASSLYHKNPNFDGRIDYHPQNEVE